MLPCSEKLGRVEYDVGRLRSAANDEMNLAASRRGYGGGLGLLLEHLFRAEILIDNFHASLRVSRSQDRLHAERYYRQLSIGLYSLTIETKLV